MPAINPFKSNVQHNAVSFVTISSNSNSTSIVQQPTAPRFNDINNININNINTRPMVRPL